MLIGKTPTRCIFIGSGKLF